MSNPSAVVTGATGVVGYRIAQHLSSCGEWDVVGISRNPPPHGSRFRSIQADLTAFADCKDKLGSLNKVTHLFYAARYDHSTGAPEPIDINLEMLKNVVEILEASSRSLQHIHIVHGTKYYGAPYGRYKTPSREDDPRCVIDNFYFAQQDFITDRQKGRSWTWTISRPQIVSDSLGHITRSIPWAIAVYASICKEQHVPLSFPGRPGNFTTLHQCTDATHLAKAVVWLATHSSCSNAAFNVTNGDAFRWENLWPRIAHDFRMPIGYAQPISLAKAMANKAGCWDTLVRNHRLSRPNYDGLVVWPYVDVTLSFEYDRISDVTKLRKAGFHDIVDTEQMFLDFFQFYRANGMIPSLDW